MHARHPHVQRVGVRKGAQRHQGGNHRDIRELRKLQQLLGGISFNDSAADIEHGLFRMRHQFHGLSYLPVVWLGDWLISLQVKRFRKAIIQKAVLHVLRDIHEHRAGAASGGQVEGSRNSGRDL